MRWKVRAYNLETGDQKTIHVEAKPHRLKGCVQDALGPEWTVHRCKLDPAPAGHSPEHRAELERRLAALQEQGAGLYTLAREYPTGSLERKRIAEASDLLRQARAKLERALEPVAADVA